MYELFLKDNSAEIEINDVKVVLPDILSDEFKVLLQECGGVSIKNGLYRIHTISSCLYWSDILNEYFPIYEGSIFPFGFDWLGRQFCINLSNKEHIMMFDPSTIQGYELEHSLVLFHNRDLVEDRDETVSENAFEEFLKELNIDKIKYKDCIAHKVPLFLGGSDDLGNYHISDIEVYWETQYQIYIG